MVRLMVDLETLDIDANGVILSAGLAVFDETKVLETYYEEFHVGGQIAHGRTVSLETQAWWVEQDAEELERLCTSGTGKLEDLVFAIKSLLDYYDIKEVWSRGSMDFLMLESIMEIPFWMARDVRTLDTFGIAEMKKNSHNALSDTLNQVEYVQEVLRWIERCTSVLSAEESSEKESAKDVTGMDKTQTTIMGDGMKEPS